MSVNVNKILFSILSSALKDTPILDVDKALCDDEIISDVFKIAKKHDIGHIIYTGLQDNNLITDSLKGYQVYNFNAIYRYEKQNYELNRVRSLLNDAEISFIILKGAVLRKYYPQPWMRTSCDIDILVKNEDLDRARDAIINELNYKYSATSTHDISLMSPGGVCLELHFELKEADFRDSKLLSHIWGSEYLIKCSDFEYQMSGELLLFYHIYHMAKHFASGGCGIKPYIDLWIIKNQVKFDSEIIHNLLKENCLWDFYVYSIALTKIWFDDVAYNPSAKEIEDYILQGGAYGTLDQQIAVSQSKKGGKFRHLLSKIFISYRSMLVYYPSLKKCPLLFPIYQIRRWCRIAFCGGRKRALDEIKLNQSLSQIKKEKVRKIIDELGL